MEIPPEELAAATHRVGTGDRQHPALKRRSFRMEPLSVLEWVLLLAVGGCALCMLALATMFVVDRHRARRNRKQSL